LYEADVGIVAQKASPYSHLVHTNKMVDYWVFERPVIATRLRAVPETYGDSVLEYYEADDAADLPPRHPETSCRTGTTRRPRAKCEGTARADQLVGSA
jgi:hypothetical protein